MSSQSALAKNLDITLDQPAVSPRNGNSITLSDKAALHYVQCKNWKEACRKAGFSKSYLEGRLYQDQHDPNSCLHLALNRIINTGLSELKVKYLSVANDWATFDANLAQHCASIPNAETLAANPKVGNAVSRVMKFLRPELDEQQVVQHTNFQIAVSQMYINAMREPPRVITHDEDD